MSSWLKRAVLWRLLWTLFLFFMSVGSIVGLYRLHLDQENLEKEGIWVQGVVVDLEVRKTTSSARGTPRVIRSNTVPTVVYKTQDGKELRTKVPTSVSYDVHVGDQVWLVYNPEYPNFVRMAVGGSSENMQLWTIFMCVLSAVWLALGIWALRATLRKKRELVKEAENPG